MAPAPSVGWAFFPLDEQLGLLSSGVTPRAEELLVRLGTWMSFDHARELLSDLLGVQVVLPLDMVDKSVTLCKDPSGWCFRHEAVRTGHLSLE